MNSMILRGYERFDRIITRGYGSGWLGIGRAEVIRFVTFITKVISRKVGFTEKING